MEKCLSGVSAVVCLLEFAPEPSQPEVVAPCGATHCPVIVRFSKILRARAGKPSARAQPFVRDKWLVNPDVFWSADTPLERYIFQEFSVDIEIPVAGVILADLPAAPCE